MSLAPSAEVRDRVLAVARAQVGTVESPRGSNRTKFGKWYGLDGLAWCAMFVSWCFAEAGMPLAASTSKGFSYTPAGAAWFRARKRWAGAKARPLPGWVVFFDFPGDGEDRISHVGIVVGVRADGAILTIEGNTDERGGRTGGKVMAKARVVTGGIVGYGITFTEAELGTAPKPTPAPPVYVDTQEPDMDALIPSWSKNDAGRWPAVSLLDGRQEGIKVLAHKGIPLLPGLDKIKAPRFAYGDTFGQPTLTITGAPAGATGLAEAPDGAIVVVLANGDTYAVAARPK